VSPPCTTIFKLVRSLSSVTLGLTICAAAAAQSHATIALGLWSSRDAKCDPGDLLGEYEQWNCKKSLPTGKVAVGTKLYSHLGIELAYFDLGRTRSSASSDFLRLARASIRTVSRSTTSAVAITLNLGTVASTALVAKVGSAQSRGSHTARAISNYSPAEPEHLFDESFKRSGRYLGLSALMPLTREWQVAFDLDHMPLGYSLVWPMGSPEQRSKKGSVLSAAVGLRWQY
jgi:hypothetical protein